MIFSRDKPPLVKEMFRVFLVHPAVLLILCLAVFMSLFSLAAGQVTTAPANSTNSTNEGPPPKYMELCDPSSRGLPCTTMTPNSACMDDGSNSGMFRCDCLKPKYAAYQFNDTSDFMCGEILSSQTEARCRECETNEGTCVRQANSQATYCQCPVSKSGTNCNKTHVNIRCTMGEMIMCYEPHIGVNVTEGWRVYANSMSHKPSCVGVVVANAANGTCPAGNLAIRFNLTDSELAQCGTRKSLDAYNIIYTNKIYAELPLSVRPNQVGLRPPFAFNIFCSFTAYKDGSFSGLGVGRINGNDRGTQVDPSGLALTAHLPSGGPVQPGMYFRVGDTLQFRVALRTDDGTYTALEVLRCTASTSPVIPDSTAETRALINSGCPLDTEPTKNSWFFEPVPNVAPGVFSIQTGKVPIFKMTKSDYVYIHCSLKLCIKGDNSCRIYNTTDCANQASASTPRVKRSLSLDDIVHAVIPVHTGAGLSRKKRATDGVAPQSANVQTGLIVRDPIAGDAASGFTVGSTGFIVVVVIGAILMLLILITIVMVIVSLTRRNTSTTEQIPHQPQFFALPRIQRTHDRL